MYHADIADTGENKNLDALRLSIEELVRKYK